MYPGLNFARLILVCIVFLCLAQGTSSAKQIAVIVNNGNSVQNISAVEIAKIFKCNTRTWTSGIQITVVVRDPSTPEMELLLSRIYKISPDELKSFIAAHKDAVVVVDSNAAMLNAVHTIPGAIGLIDVFSINQQVKVVKIDGKLPVEYGYILRGN
jgi:ABC-type phosphate transport system substrate-binding protein